MEGLADKVWKKMAALRDVVVSLSSKKPEVEGSPPPPPPGRGSDMLTKSLIWCSCPSHNHCYFIVLPPCDTAMLRNKIRHDKSSSKFDLDPARDVIGEPMVHNIELPSINFPGPSNTVSFL